MFSRPLSVARQLRTCSGPPQTDAAIWRAVVLPEDDPPSKLNPPPSRPARRSNGPAKAAQGEAQTGIADGKHGDFPPTFQSSGGTIQIAVMRGLQNHAFAGGIAVHGIRQEVSGVVPAGAGHTANTAGGSDG